MAKGFSLHLGLNSVDPVKYNGWSGKLRACEADALSMQKIAKINGYNAKTLLTAQATSGEVLRILSEISQTLQSGDIFLFTYSGHGGQIPDTNGGDEDDGLDETWVLYDRMLVDDELFTQWAKFKNGVRIFVLSDSCHSGTVLRAMPPIAEFLPLYNNFSLFPDDSTGNSISEKYDEFRIIPDEIQRDVYLQNENSYREIQSKNPQTDRSRIGANLLLISGCQDNQLSRDGIFNGEFTSKLLSVWNNGNFKGNYEQFYKEIRRRMPPLQTPNIFTIGDIKAFNHFQPFSINEQKPIRNDSIQTDTTPPLNSNGYRNNSKNRISINIEIKNCSS